jgi:hypothetical protein
MTCIWYLPPPTASGMYGTRRRYDRLCRPSLRRFANSVAWLRRNAWLPGSTRARNRSSRPLITAAALASSTPSMPAATRRSRSAAGSAPADGVDEAFAAGLPSGPRVVTATTAPTRPSATRATTTSNRRRRWVCSIYLPCPPRQRLSTHIAGAAYGVTQPGQPGQPGQRTGWYVFSAANSCCSVRPAYLRIASARDASFQPSRAITLYISTSLLMPILRSR